MTTTATTKTGLKKLLQLLYRIWFNIMSFIYRLLPILTPIAIISLLLCIGQTTGITGIGLSYGTSMYPNLPSGLALDFFEGISTPDYYDVVSFTIPEDDDRFAIENVLYSYCFENSRRMTKRVIALPGDDVHITGDEIYVNNELIDTSYFGDTYEGWNTRNLEKSYEDIDGYFLLGDNRQNSFDSFYLGPIPEDLINGTLVFIWELPEFIQKKYLHD